MAKSYYIGIDIGGTKISAGLITPKGKVKERVKIPAPKDPTSSRMVYCLLQLVNTLLKEAKVPRRQIKGIGVGVPGLVNHATGTVLNTPNLGLVRSPLAALLRNRLKIPVKIGNDANVGTVAERLFGAARGCREVVGIFCGTGVGGGIVTSGTLMLGAHGAAAEIGHIPLEREGPKCSCGNKGCLEAFAGRWAIERRIRKAMQEGRASAIEKISGRGRPIKSKALKQALEKHDPLVTEVMHDAARAIAAGCVSLRHILDPEVIVLGGGVMEACGKYMLPWISAEVEKDPFFNRFGKCRIVLAELEDDAVMLGAAAMCF